MKFNLSSKTLTISVRELIYHTINYSGTSNIPRRLRGRIGQDIHREYQNKSQGDAEFYIKWFYKVNDWNIELRGRIDILKIENGKYIIEEIKSVNNLEEDIENAHILQLLFYAHYFIVVKKIDNIIARLIRISIKDRIRRVDEFKTSDQSELIIKLTEKVISNIKKKRYSKSELVEKASSLTFPFDSYRMYQKEIMNKIYENLSEEKQIVLSSPPGIGKTMGSLFPSLRLSLEKGYKLLVVSSKTTQQNMYYNTIKALMNSGAKITSIIIRAKSKMCHIEKQNCDNHICEYLDKYENIETKSIVSDLLDLQLITGDEIQMEASKYEICPFELSMDTALMCDIVIGDYNYAFHPRIQLQRYLNDLNEERLIIVDEAHNLPERANGYYSGELSVKELKQIITLINNELISDSLKLKGKSILNKFIRYIKGLSHQIENIEYAENAVVEFDIPHFEKLQDDFDDFILSYIDYKGEENILEDELVNFGERLKYFSLLVTESWRDEFSQIYDLDLSQMRVLCKSSSKKLFEQFENYKGVVLQSATLKPFTYYTNILGISNHNELLDYPSPFPKQNQLYLIYPHLSTKFSERENYFSLFKNIIKQGVQYKNGNYIIFVPSFTVLKEVVRNFNAHTYTILEQKRTMTDIEREDILEILRTTTNNILFAVVGGIFSEGVDYKGDMAHGVFIFGPGLPSYNFDQELKRLYFDKHFRNGFDYAYKFPGLSKVIQAAGRVFRSENDRGFVLLCGYRFANEEYLGFLPSHWNIKISDDPELDIKNFWNSK